MRPPHHGGPPSKIRDVDFIVPARVNTARLMPIYFANYSQKRDLIRRIRWQRRTESFTLQRIGDFVDLAQDSSQDDLSLQQAGGSWAPPLNASTARKPRSTFDFQSCYDNA